MVKFGPNVQAVFSQVKSPRTSRQARSVNRTRRQSGSWALAQSAVTSATSVPLQAEAQVKNRLFPKTRSWFALDAPLALLSPLSVLRIVFLFAALTWILLALIWPLPHADRATVLIVAATALVVWATLLRFRRATTPWCWALTGLWLAEVSTLVSTGNGGGLSGSRWPALRALRGPPRWPSSWQRRSQPRRSRWHC
jgi:hypothetical protein